jgi:hypothetical protein
MATYTANILGKGVSTMRVSGRITTGIALGTLMTMMNLGCAAKQPEIRDTWTPAAQQANASASRAEAAASRAEAAAGRAEAAAKRVEDSAARVEAMFSKQLRK